MRLLIVVLLFAQTTPLSPEVRAMDALRSNEKVFNEQMAQHWECHGSKEYKPTPFCESLNAHYKATEQVNVALDAYCSVNGYSKKPIPTNPCQSKGKSPRKLNVAVANLNAVTAKIQKNIR